MRESVKTILWVLIGFMLFFAPKAFAENIRPVFCPEMEDEATYDKFRFKSYKMLVAGNDGWIFRSESDLKRDFEIQAETLKNLSLLKDKLKQKGVHLVILYTPTRGMIHHNQITKDITERYDYDPDTVWDSYSKAVQAMKDVGLDVVGFDRLEQEKDFFYKRDHHWNAAGAKKAADRLVSHINELPIKKDIPVVKYETKKNEEEYYYYGIFKKVFKRVCNSDQPPEIIKLYRTEKADTATGESALFGEVQEPEIVLAGTSNSTPEPSLANFHGFLQEGLQADVLNMSVSGGGLEAGILDYLNSDFYARNPAKILIWEIPSYYDLDNQNWFFREAMPATNPQCEVVAEARQDPIQYDQFIALDDLEKFKVHGSDYYLRLNFEKPISNAFTVEFRYAKNREKYKFSRPVQTESETRFNVSLRDDKRQYLDKVILHIPLDMTGQKFDASLCRNP